MLLIATTFAGDCGLSVKGNTWSFFIAVLYSFIRFFLVRSIGSVRRRQWHPAPVLLPGKSHGRRSLVGCCLWGRTESDNDWSDLAAVAAALEVLAMERQVLHMKRKFYQTIKAIGFTKLEIYFQNIYEIRSLLFTSTCWPNITQQK